jgi:hypothetical protein
MDRGNHDSCDSTIRGTGKTNGVTPQTCTFGYTKKGVAFQMIDTETKVSSYKNAVESNFAKWQADPNIKQIHVALHRQVVTFPGAHHPENEIDKQLRPFMEYLAAKYPKFTVIWQGHNHFFLVCFPVKPHVMVVTDGTANTKDPYPIGKTMDDGCKNGLSGTKYNGFSEADIDGSHISVKHISIKGGNTTNFDFSSSASDNQTNSGGGNATNTNSTIQKIVIQNLPGILVVPHVTGPVPVTVTGANVTAYINSTDSQQLNLSSYIVQ